jgi:prepilin-type N-terminal cleavage/methylation domain-containing protein
VSRLRRAVVARVRDADRREAGLTLIEVLVTVFLLGIVSLISTGAVIQSNKLLVASRDENEGMSDVRTVIERMGRDIRDARGVTCDGGLADPADSTSSDPSCNSHLQLWVDYDSDYVMDDSEIVTWRLTKGSDGLHYNVVRIQGNGQNGNVPISQIQASTLVVKFAFTYDSTPPATQVVNIGMRYDSEVGIGTAYRNVAFSARLRNKG